MDAAQNALALDQHDADAYALMGSIYRYQGEHEKGIPLHEKALELSPNHANNMGLMAAGLLQLAQPERCLTLIKQAMRLNPIYPAWMLNIVAVCNYQLNNYDEAITASEEHRKRVPNDILGACHYGVYLCCS